MTITDRINALKDKISGFIPRGSILLPVALAAAYCSCGSPEVIKQGPVNGGYATVTKSKGFNPAYSISAVFQKQDTTYYMTDADASWSLTDYGDFYLYPGCKVDQGDRVVMTVGGDTILEANTWRYYNYMQTVEEELGLVKGKQDTVMLVSEVPNNINGLYQSILCNTPKVSEKGGK